MVPFLRNGPCCYLFLLLRDTIHLSVRLLLRVLKPRVGWPQGVTGWRPPEVLPSPPPCGWSTGFMVTPRLCGAFPCAPSGALRGGVLCPFSPWVLYGGGWPEERVDCFSSAATPAGMPALSRLKSMTQWACLSPPPMNREVTRPVELRPPVRC